jgi:hypothetical protein
MPEMAAAGHCDRLAVTGRSTGRARSTPVRSARRLVEIGSPDLHLPGPTAGVG